MKPVCRAARGALQPCQQRCLPERKSRVDTVRERPSSLPCAQGMRPTGCLRVAHAGALPETGQAITCPPGARFPCIAHASVRRTGDRQTPGAIVPRAPPTGASLTDRSSATPCPGCAVCEHQTGASLTAGPFFAPDFARASPSPIGKDFHADAGHAKNPGATPDHLRKENKPIRITRPVRRQPWRCGQERALPCVCECPGPANARWPGSALRCDQTARG